MEFQALLERAAEVRQQYAAFEQTAYGRTWSPEEIALGFVGDVGDVMKLVMAQEGIRNIPDAQDKLAHELADCLWSVLVLADVYKINLENAFLNTMDEIEERLKS